MVIVSAGPAVLNAKYVGMFGSWFLALCPAVGVGLAICAFTKISMAHYNPAVTIGFLITKHMPRNLIGLYIAAEFIGAFLGILFVKYVIGTQANLGANAPKLFISNSINLRSRSCGHHICNGSHPNCCS
ncbi:MAG TPA: aquaporin [Candidatus Nitrosotalea sp.]|nr:aquaporin [Candidatus Nitrosotalea sp.]